MGRVKGAKNKIKKLVPISSEERLHVLANIIIDRILEERAQGRLAILGNLKTIGNE